MAKLTSIILIISLSLIAASSNSNVEIVAQFEMRPGNPAVSPDGRIFLSMQPLDDPVYRVVKLPPDGTTKPFPKSKNGGRSLIIKK